MTEMERPSTGCVLRCAVMLPGHGPAWGFWLPAGSAPWKPNCVARARAAWLRTPTEIIGHSMYVYRIKGR